MNLNHRAVPVLPCAPAAPLAFAATLALPYCESQPRAAGPEVVQQVASTMGEMFAAPGQSGPLGVFSGWDRGWGEGVLQVFADLSPRAGRLLAGVRVEHLKSKAWSVTCEEEVPLASVFVQVADPRDLAIGRLSGASGGVVHVQVRVHPQCGPELLEVVQERVVQPLRQVMRDLVAQHRGDLFAFMKRAPLPTGAGNGRGVDQLVACLPVQVREVVRRSRVLAPQDLALVLECWPAEELAECVGEAGFLAVGDDGTDGTGHVVLPDLGLRTLFPLLGHIPNSSFESHPYPASDLTVLTRIISASRWLSALAATALPTPWVREHREGVRADARSHPKGAGLFNTPLLAELAEHCARGAGISMDGCDCG